MQSITPRPLVVALVGLPGAGKSEVASFLARELALRLVSRDAIRAAMFPQCRYSPAEKRAELVPEHHGTDTVSAAGAAVTHRWRSGRAQVACCTRISTSCEW